MLTFQEFSRANYQRCIRSDGFNHRLQDWSTSDWMVAVMGELGEAANLVKKLNRVRDGIAGNDEHPMVLEQKLASELADVDIYLDLIFQSRNLNREAEIIKAWNAKSLKIGYPVLL